MLALGPAFVQRRMSEAIGAPVELASARVTLTGGPGLWVRELSAVRPDGSLRLRARSLLVSLKLSSLLPPRFVVTEVRVEDGVVEIADATVLPSLVRTPSAELAAARFRLKDVELRHGMHAVKLHELMFDRAEVPAKAFVLSFAAENPRPEIGRPFPHWLPRISGHLRLRLEGDEVVLEDVSLSDDNAMVTGAARLRVTEQGVTITRSRWQAPFGRFSATGRFPWRESGLPWQVDVAAIETDVRSLRAAPLLASVWPRTGPLATADGAITASLVVEPAGAATRMTLRSFTLDPRAGAPRLELAGRLDVEGSDVALRDFQGRVGGMPVTAEGALVGAGSRQWSLDGSFQTVLAFPRALDVVAPGAAGGAIALGGNVPVRGGLSLTSAGGSLRVEARAEDFERLDFSELRKTAGASGRLAATTSWRGGGGWSSTVDFSLSVAEVASLPVRDLSAQAVVDAGRVDVRELRFRLDGGSAEGRARVEPSATEIALRVRGAEADTVLGALAGLGGRLFGRLSLDLDLLAVPGRRDEMLRRARGVVELVVEDGRLEGVELPGRLLQLATLAHEGMTDFNLDRTLRTVRPEPIDHVELLSGRFEIADGVARTDNLVFVAHNLGLQAKGTIDLARRTFALAVEGQVPKVGRDHTGWVRRTMAKIRLGEAVDVVRRIPGLDVLLGKVEKEHVFRLRVTGELSGETRASDFSWVR